MANFVNFEPINCGYVIRRQSLIVLVDFCAVKCIHKYLKMKTGEK